MITTANAQKNEVSMVDALWVLIQSQSKTVRMALTRRLLEEQEKTDAQQQMVEEASPALLTNSMLARPTTMPETSSNDSP